jgi:hypothetical protein
MAWRWGILVLAVIVAASCSKDDGGGDARPDAGTGGSVGTSGTGGSGGSLGSGGNAGTSGNAGVSGSAGSSGTSGSGGAAGSSGTDGGSAGDCPASPPSQLGAECPLALGGTWCSYGDSVLPECRDQWQCECVSQQPGVRCVWQRANVEANCNAHDAGDCPANAPPKAADGGLPACDDAASGARCGYTDGTICLCTSCLELGGPCQPVAPPRWSCSSPPANPDCPRTIPNSGGECTRADLACNYDSFCGLQARCENRKWVWSQLPCPQ